MKIIGLNKWDGKYTWFNEFNDVGIKHVVKYNVLKGFNGSFSYGNCFYFMPTVSNGRKLINHRTDKSTIQQLFERLDGWKASFENGNKNDVDFISHWNENLFIQNLNKFLDEYPAKIKLWFDDNQNIEQNISTALNQINQGKSYDLHGPDQKYVLAFLYAGLGKYSVAYKYLQEYYEPLVELDEKHKVEWNLVLKRIDKMKD